VKQREHAIQSLELAYHKYKEIEANLAEGTRASYPIFFTGRESELQNLQFHQDFSILLKSFKDECRQWANQRSSELEYVVIDTAPSRTAEN
jgi:programmed cell death 6-interacting protein